MCFFKEVSKKQCACDLGRDGSGDQAQLFWRVFGSIDDEAVRQLARAEGPGRRACVQQIGQTALMIGKSRVVIAAAMVVVTRGKGRRGGIDIRLFGRSLRLSRGVMIMADLATVLQRCVRDVVAEIRDAMSHHAADHGDANEGAKGVNQFVQISLMTAVSRPGRNCNVAKWGSGCSPPHQS